MPYFITDKETSCNGWATVKADGEVIGCHTNKQGAIDQMVAVSLAEKIVPGGELKDAMRALLYELVVGDYVSWDETGNTLYGEITFISTFGQVNTPTGGQMIATQESPVATIQVYEMFNGGLQDTQLFVMKRLAPLTKLEQLPQAQDETLIQDMTRAVGDPKAIIVDIDDTLIHLGKPMQGVIDAINAMDGRKIIVTARPVAQREETVKQLDEFGVNYTALFMKDVDQPTPEWKASIAKRLLTRYDIVLAVDNDEANRKAFEALGIKSIHPSELESMRNLESRAVNQDAPAYMRANARRGLAYYADSQGGQGLVERTIREARLMADGKVSDDKWVRIAAWIARHIGDLDSPDADPTSPNYPSPGVVAHLLWGSGSNRRQAQRTLEYAQAVSDRVKLDQANRSNKMTGYEIRDAGDWDLLNDRQQEQAENQSNVALEYGMYNQSTDADGAHYAPAANNPFKAEGLICNNCIFYNENAQQCQIVEGMIEPEAICKLWVIPESYLGIQEPMTETVNEMNARWKSVTLNLRSKEGQSMETTVERRVNNVEFDIRAAEASSDGMSFTGYAAVFNSPSEPLPFTEVIKEGAFKRSLKSRNEIKLFMNHNTDVVLGSTRAGTLRLTEDSRGLLATADLPDTTAGRDLSVLMKRGDVSSMSFGFSVPPKGDTWSQDGNTRELHQVRLHEVSIVTGFPAYEATTASVRSLDILATRTAVDVDALSDAITRLEAGETLEADHANLISEVVSKLRADVPNQNDLLEIKRKQLDLMLKAF